MRMTKSFCGGLKHEFAMSHVENAYEGPARMDDPYVPEDMRDRQIAVLR